MPLLELRSITKDFPGVPALDGVSFDLEKGEGYALCGENGAGKSTLIKVEPDEHRALLAADLEGSDPGRGIGVVLGLSYLGLRRGSWVRTAR